MKRRLATGAMVVVLGLSAGLPVGAAPYTPAANNPSGKATFNP